MVDRYNNKVFGLSGREAVPHSQFWFMDLRGLVADGCYYSLDIAKVRLTSLPRPLFLLLTSLPRPLFLLLTSLPRPLFLLVTPRCSQVAYARLHKCLTGQDVPDTSEYAYSRAPTFEADVDQD